MHLANHQTTAASHGLLPWCDPYILQLFASLESQKREEEADSHRKKFGPAPRIGREDAAAAETNVWREAPLRQYQVQCA